MPDAAGSRGAGYRALRHLLQQVDPERKFGGMRRFATPEGDWHWICREHIPEYDPGLPKLPCPTGEGD